MLKAVNSRIVYVRHFVNSLEFKVYSLKFIDDYF